MDKFQIEEVTEKFANAGTKAMDDVTVIAKGNAYQQVRIVRKEEGHSIWQKIMRQTRFGVDWIRAYRTITPGATVLLQQPFHTRHLWRRQVLKQLKQTKNVRFISVVHDVEELRSRFFNDYYQEEFRFMLSISDVIIVHNEIMARFFVERGYPERQLVVLEIFDYLQENLHNKPIVFERTLTIAGNLDSKKVPYLSELDQLRVPVHLYGPNFEEKNNYSQTIYHGSFPPEEIPNQLNRGFGVVWDGESIQNCIGYAGEYLRYNNPHKLSLYLASGLPVIVWREAATAQFVKKHQVGYVVADLRQVKDILDKITEQEYRKLLMNVSKVRDELLAGKYMLRALNEAEQQLLHL